MAVKPLQSIAGAQPLPKLAPDLTSWSDRDNATSYVRVTGVNCTAGLTTMLSLTGKFLINIIFLEQLSANDVEGIKLTIDGVVIWSETGLSSNSASEPVLGQTDGDNGMQIRCDSAFLLEVDCISDTSIAITYLVRPIL